MSQIYPGNACNDKHPTNIAHSDQLTEIVKVFIVVVIHLSILKNENFTEHIKYMYQFASC